MYWSLICIFLKDVSFCHKYKKIEGFLDAEYAFYNISFVLKLTL